VDDYYTNYSDGSGQQFITLVSKSGNTFYLVIDRNAKGQQTVHFMNLVDESDLLALMEDEDADAYTAEKEAAAQAELERKQAEEDAKKAEEEAAASGTEQPKENKITKYAATFLGVIALVALAAGSGFYVFMKQKQKKQAEKEALDPDADYTEDKGDFEIPVEDEPDADEAPDEQNPENS
jgi:multidrug efflux pump subunit AcrA (membrane-fusion protein)